MLEGCFLRRLFFGIFQPIVRNRPGLSRGEKPAMSCRRRRLRALSAPWLAGALLGASPAFAHYGPLPDTNVIVTPPTPGGLVFHPTDPYAYVVGRETNDITVFRADRASGRLCGFARIASGGTLPTFGSSFDNTGDNLYVLHGESNDIVQFRVDHASGKLSEVDRIELSAIPQAGLYPYVLTLDASNAHAYVAMYRSNNLLMFDVDAADGRLRFRRSIPTGNGPVALLFDVSGRYAVVNNMASNRLQLFAVDGDTGDLRLLQNFSAPGLYAPFFAMAHPDGSGLFYAVAGGANCIVPLRLAGDGDEARLELAGPGVATGVGANTLPVFSDDRRYLYEANVHDNTLSMYRIVGPQRRLEPLQPPSIPVGSGPIQFKKMPGTPFVYTVDYYANTLHAYRLSADGLPRPVIFD